VALLELDGDHVRSVAVLPGPDPDRHEKNWMPFVRDGELCFLYSCQPTEVFRWGGGGLLEPVSRRTAPARAATFRGGSQGLAVDDGVLFVVHEADEQAGVRRYRHRFVLLDNDLAVSAISRPFRFFSTEIEFCAGLARRGGDLLMTFGVGDHTAMLAVINETSALALLDG
jgi:hypothetical protein